MVVYNKKVAVVLIKYHNAEISKTKRSYNLKVFGKSLVNWTKGELKKLNPEVVLINKNNTLYSALKKYYESADFVAVFYYDTPLLTETTATTCIDYAVLKDLDVCNLPKGFVFKTEFLKKQENENKNEDENKKTKQEKINSEAEKEQESSLKKINASNITKSSLFNYESGFSENNNLRNENGFGENLNSENVFYGNENGKYQIAGYAPNIQNFMHFEGEFLQAYNQSNLKKVESAIKQKIVNYHKSNGVLFVEEFSVYVDYDCKIAAGCVIHPNNFILNGSVIGKNCVFMTGNVVDNCVLQEGLTITYCVLKNSVINKVNAPLPFSVVENNVLIK